MSRQYLLLFTLLITFYLISVSVNAVYVNPWNIVYTQGAIDIDTSKGTPTCWNPCSGTSDDSCKSGFGVNTLNFVITLHSGEDTQYSQFCVPIDQFSQMEVKDCMLFFIFF